MDSQNRQQRDIQILDHVSQRSVLYRFTTPFYMSDFLSISISDQQYVMGFSSPYQKYEQQPLKLI